MANRYYRVPLGGDSKEDVTEAGTSSLSWLEVGITYDASGNSKMLAIKALDAVKQYLLADPWPPV